MELLPTLTFGSQRLNNFEERLEAQRKKHDEDMESQRKKHDEDMTKITNLMSAQSANHNDEMNKMKEAQSKNEKEIVSL